MLRRCSALVLLSVISGLPITYAGEKEWMPLFTTGLGAFRGPHTDWQEVAEVGLDAKNPRKFEAKPGQGVFYNGPKGNARNLFTKNKFGDLEVHLEFNLPKGSNSHGQRQHWVVWAI